MILAYSESFFDETTFLQLSNDEVITISWRFYDDLYDGLCSQDSWIFSQVVFITKTGI